VCQSRFLSVVIQKFVQTKQREKMRFFESFESFSMLLVNALLIFTNILLYISQSDVSQTSSNGCRGEHAQNSLAVDDGDDDLRRAA
jgi:hypothetical protein